MTDNLQNKAIAVKYGTNGSKHEVVADLNERNIEKLILEAIENNIPVHKNPELLKQLTKENFRQDMPEALYGVVAETINFIYGMDAKAGMDSKVIGAVNA